MLPASKRRNAPHANLPLPLSTSRDHLVHVNPHQTGYATANGYKDKALRPQSLRIRLQHALTRKSALAALFVAAFVSLAWAVGLLGNSPRSRSTVGAKGGVVVRDWQQPGLGVKGVRGGILIDELGVAAPAQLYNETVLILCPMRNAIEHIWHFFHLVDSLSYPRHLIHLAVLVSDTTDGTYQRAVELADERQYGHQYRGNRYGRISVYQKDFAATAANQGAGSGDDYAGQNVGKERHDYAVQVGRRKLLGKSRTWLLSTALVPEVDWVLWADVDVVDYESTLIERLMAYAKGSLPESSTSKIGADVVVPNCVWKTYNEMGAYDRNNWVETPESQALKATLPADRVLIEGYKDHPTYRFNLASLAPSHPSQLAPHNPYLAAASLALSTLAAYPPPGDITLPLELVGAHSIPDTIELDGVGGCAALVRAEVHREGAVFPAWPPVDHQLETEGFAQLVKALRRPNDASATSRGRLLGLPRYYVYHGLYG
ncbi:hypothetical protein BMF94_3834 [Rhodotorula taiwanensis]|uniref:Uncharacterized protein n=1 Tax=Rhodotorula taiwanensis TaxID=741276 RepID=A0A2S5B8U4_9BASI|nr:hypothetical protein BMF94_3834 [Rhodotorula taiwanensis]